MNRMIQLKQTTPYFSLYSCVALGFCRECRLLFPRRMAAIPGNFREGTEGVPLHSRCRAKRP
jgi:hypothetical protein